MYVSNLFYLIIITIKIVIVENISIVVVHFVNKFKKVVSMYIKTNLGSDQKLIEIGRILVPG